MPLCNAGSCIAFATHGSVCAVHAKHPRMAQSPQEVAEFLRIGIDYDFRPESYLTESGAEEEWIPIAALALDNALSDILAVEACERWEGIELRVSDHAEG